MALKIILVDTSILIDLFRKTEKSNSTLISLVRQGYNYCISAVTEYEIYRGASMGQLDFWDAFLVKTKVLPFDKKVARVAVDLHKQLKTDRKLIDTADLFIAATAISNNIPMATLNKKHFDRITPLSLVN